MRVSVDVLRKATEIVYAHLVEELGLEHVEIDDEYYWELPDEYLYDVTREPAPKEYEVGQLSYDFERLKEITEDPELGISYALVWLSSVLKAVGKKIVR